MTLSQFPPIWKEAPFIRIIIPFLAGIALEEYLNADTFLIWLVFLCCAACLALVHFSSLFIRFRYSWLAGIFINLIFFCCGDLVCANAHDSNHKNSILNNYSANALVQVTIAEPPVEKSGSYKALAAVDRIFKNDSAIASFGKVILYFPKDSNFRILGCGSSLIFPNTLQPIRSSGNPGSFDYQTYCQRQGIHYSVYLKAGDYRVIPGFRKIFLKRILFQTRENVLDILSRYIPDREESGFAKALLIGYKDDLDKNVVQSYSNTGVVHIIAISGLHLGIIYWLLNLVLSPISMFSRSRWIKAILIILGLWTFSLLAGGGPSVLRSAFMFSFIVIGNANSKSVNIYNSLAASAFVLLCIDPFWLWDVGFQLSYAAVLSIVIFFKAIYHFAYFPNRIVDFTWKLISVTLAAQILTLPLCIFHFHQIPVYFILANLVAVPWSTLILLAEILLCCVAFLPGVAKMLGALIHWMIQFLNDFISNINTLPFSTWDHLQISNWQLLMLFLMICFMSAFFAWENKKALFGTLLSVLAFASIRTYSFYCAERQNKLVIYNMQNGQLMDFINGRKCVTIGNADALNNPYASSMILKPAHTLFRTRETTESGFMLSSANLVQFNGKNLLFLGGKKKFIRTKVDILILTGRVQNYRSSILSRLHPGVVVASGPGFTTWKSTCDSLGIRFHDLRTGGAFIFDFH